MQVDNTSKSVLDNQNALCQYRFNYGTSTTYIIPLIPRETSNHRKYRSSKHMDFLK